MKTATKTLLLATFGLAVLALARPSRLVAALV